MVIFLICFQPAEKKKDPSDKSAGENKNAATLKQVCSDIFYAFIMRFLYHSYKHLAGRLDQQLKAVDINIAYPHQLSTTPHFRSFRIPNLLTLTLSPVAGRTDRTCSSCTSRRSETRAAVLLKLPTPHRPGAFGVSLTHDPHTCTRFWKTQLMWGRALVFQCRSA